MSESEHKRTLLSEIKTSFRFAILWHNGCNTMTPSKHVPAFNTIFKSAKPDQIRDWQQFGRMVSQAQCDHQNLNQSMFRHAVISDSDGPDIFITD